MLLKVQFLTQPHFIVQPSPQTLFESMRPVEIGRLVVLIASRNYLRASDFVCFPKNKNVQE